MQEVLQKMNVNSTEKVLRAALRGDKVVIDGVTQKQGLFEALMVKPTDGLKRQAEAARTLKAFLLEPVKQPENESE